MYITYYKISVAFKMFLKPKYKLFFEIIPFQNLLKLKFKPKCIAFHLLFTYGGNNCNSTVLCSYNYVTIRKKKSLLSLIYFYIQDILGFFFFLINLHTLPFKCLSLFCSFSVFVFESNLCSPRLYLWIIQ